MGLLDAAIGSALGAFGKKPTVPTFTPVDPTAEANKATTGNLNNFSNISHLASMTDDANQNNLLAQLRKVIPNLDQITGKASANILDELGGKLPTDVSDAVQSSAAAKSLGGGYGGTGMNRSLVARDLGLTSLDLTGKGLSSAESWLSTVRSAATPAQFDLSSMFVSPQLQTASAFQNNSNTFQTNWLQSQISAMPDPTAAAFASGISQDLGGVSSALGSYYGVGKSKSEGGSM